VTENFQSRSNKIWDSLAVDYSISIRGIYKEAIKLQLLLQTIQPDYRCLDIGSASGVFSYAIAPKVKKVVSLDLSYQMVYLLRQHSQENHIGNLYPLQQNGENLGFKSASFDLAFCYATLSLVPDPMKLLEEVRRILVPGGKAILDITNKYNLAQVYWSKFYIKNGYISQRSFTHSGITKVFSDLGFKIEKMVPVGLLDQWKYIPGVHKMKFLDKWVHQYQGEIPDRDARWSSRFPKYANHWFYIVEKQD
jgi:ubiquinone/menaquinone biosynthesis C-methylase UbiE